MNFDVAVFKSPPIPASFERGGQVLEMELDPDILTAEFLDEMARLAEKEEGVSSATATQQDVAFSVNILSRLIKKWNAKREGQPIEPSAEFFRTLPLGALTDLFAFCMEAATGTKKQTEPPSADLSSQVVA